MLIGKNRCFAYPVLANFTQDYKKGSLTANIKCKESLKGYSIKVDCKISDNEDIENLAKNHKCVYVCHVECVSTKFRKAFISNKPEISFELMQSNVSGNTEFSINLIAKERIENFTSKYFTSFLKGNSVSFDKGSFVAVGPQYQKYFPVLKENSNNSSFITINLSEKKDSPMEVEIINDEKIVIFLYRDEFKLYAKYKNRNSVKPFILQMVILPALIEVLGLIQSEGESYQEKFWYKQLEDIVQNIYKDKEKNLDEFVSDVSHLVLAQKILKNPLFEFPSSIQCFEFPEDTSIEEGD